MFLYLPSTGFYFTRRSLLQDVYDGLMPSTIRPAGMLFLETETKEQFFAIVTQEDDGYLVSVLKEPKQNKDSYIEVNVNEAHSMYPRIRDICSMLNIAGIGQEVEGVGEAFETALYKVILTKDENEELVK